MINKYTKNLFISSSPGLISIFLSFFSIPVYLQYLGYEEYGNYLILHILLSITMITNLNLGKIASVRIQKVISLETKKIIFTTLLFSLLSSTIITVLFFFIIKLLFYLFEIIFFENNIYFYLSLFLANIYVNLENLCKGKKFFKLCGLSNLIFYSLSISIPCFFLMYGSENYQNALELFKISFVFKIIGVLILIIFLFYKKLILIGKISEIILKDFMFYVKWQTLSSTYMQIFDFLDKYIIKLILGSANLSIYSIPQQIAGKLSIISDSLISVFLPRISSSKSKKTKYEILNSNFYGFFYLVGFPLLILIPFLDNLIFWWLGENTSPQIIYLFKIFMLVSFYVCTTHIITIYYDSTFQSKKNSEIDTIILILFLFGIIFSVYSNNLNYFAYTILFKSILSFILKVKFIEKFIINFKILFAQNILFLSSFFFQIIEFKFMYFLTCLLFSIILIRTAPVKLLKKEFFR